MSNVLIWCSVCEKIAGHFANNCPKVKDQREDDIRRAISNLKAAHDDYIGTATEAECWQKVRDAITILESIVQMPNAALCHTANNDGGAHGRQSKTL